MVLHVLLATRLQILNLLRTGERSVGELAQLCGYTSANISRHLAFLTQQGLVERESRGTSGYYRLADESVYALCDLVCGTIGRQLERKATGRQVFVRSARPATKARLRTPVFASHFHVSVVADSATPVLRDIKRSD